MPSEGPPCEPNELEPLVVDRQLVRDGHYGLFSARPVPAMVRRMATNTRRHPVYWIFLALAVGLSLVALYWAFFKAPIPAMKLPDGRVFQMRFSQKIFYWHVPTAMAMELMFLLCGAASFVFLYNHSPKADRLAIATAEVGVLMALFVLISGPLWARTEWGHYWEWEPRLVLTMVVMFMYAAYIALRVFGGDDGLSKQIAAGLAVAGMPAIYLIRIAVRRWRGTHPRVVWEGGLQEPNMRIAFWTAVAAFLFIAAVLTWERMRLERAKNEVTELTLEMMERDLLEEEDL